MMMLPAQDGQQANNSPFASEGHQADTFQRASSAYDLAAPMPSMAQLPNPSFRQRSTVPGRFFGRRSSFGEMPSLKHLPDAEEGFTFGSASVTPGDSPRVGFSREPSPGASPRVSPRIPHRGGGGGVGAAARQAPGSSLALCSLVMRGPALLWVVVGLTCIMIVGGGVALQLRAGVGGPIADRPQPQAASLGQTSPIEVSVPGFLVWRALHGGVGWCTARSR